MADRQSIKVQNKENQRFYRVKLIWFRIKHGLFLLTVRNVLMRLGLDIEPYWIELESPDFCTEPLIRDDVSLYHVKFINDDLLTDQFKLLGWSSKLLDEKLNSNHMSVGLFCVDELAAFMIVTLDSFNSKDRIITLEKNEAYLEYMYTLEKFRGKVLAPYLRYKTYTLLNNRGINVFYSGTQYFNKSSLSFKKKLGAKHLQFWLHIGLFKKFKWNFLLKKYDVKI